MKLHSTNLSSEIGCCRCELLDRANHRINFVLVRHENGKLLNNVVERAKEYIGKVFFLTTDCHTHTGTSAQMIWNDDDYDNVFWHFTQTLLVSVMKILRRSLCDKNVLQLITYIVFYFSSSSHTRLVMPYVAHRNKIHRTRKENIVADTFKVMDSFDQWIEWDFVNVCSGLK